MNFKQITRDDVVKAIEDLNAYRATEDFTNSPFEDTGQSELFHALDHTECSWQTLGDLDLHGFVFWGIDWNHTDLTGANLSGCSFQCSDLRGVNFSGCNIEYCTFYCCDLQDARFYNIESGITDDTFNGALIEDIQLQGSHVPQTSHELVGEILRQHAYNDRQYMMAGWISMKKSACWARFIARLVHEGWDEEMEWAYNVLLDYPNLRNVMDGYKSRIMKSRNREDAMRVLWMDFPEPRSERPLTAFTGPDYQTNSDIDAPEETEDELERHPF
jgi:hypothetical protein